MNQHRPSHKKLPRHSQDFLDQHPPRRSRPQGQYPPGQARQGYPSQSPLPQSFTPHLGADYANRHRKRSKKPLVFAVLLLALIAVALGVLFQMGYFDRNPNLVPAGKEVRVEIPDGSGADAVGNILYEAGLFDSKKLFAKEVERQKATSQIKSGIYVFNGGTPLDQLVKHLVEGPGQSENVYAIPEGYTLEKTAKAVSEAYAGVISEQDFLDVAHDASQFEQRFPFVKGAYNNSLEGFLFPKTYEVIQGSTAADVVAQMLEQYAQEVKALNYSYPKEQGLSDYQTLILASIIEREAAHDNKAMVASVFYNRLAIDMALQSDATTAYVIGGDPRPEDLKKEDPFNTYLNKGLPPGPICSPGLASLEAACNPETSNYYYFYFKDNGKGGLDYFFSETYEQHQAAIAG